MSTAVFPSIVHCKNIDFSKSDSRGIFAEEIGFITIIGEITVPRRLEVPLVHQELQRREDQAQDARPQDGAAGRVAAEVVVVGVGKRRVRGRPPPPPHPLLPHCGPRLAHFGG